MTYLQKQLIETYEKEGYSAVLDFWKKNTDSIKKLAPNEVSILNNMMERYSLVNNDEKNLKNIFSGKTENTPQEQEILKALKRFGFLLSEGGVVTKNEYDAEKIFIMLAEKGSSEDTYNLAERYMKGDGIIKDIQKAIEYFVKASKDGNKKASFILGEIYMKGEYIPKDKSQALKWYLLANEKNNSSSNDFSTMIIPDGITCIEESAFEGFENLVKVVIPDSVNLIKKNAFKECKNLCDVVISNRNVSIAVDAFEKCENITKESNDCIFNNSFVLIKGEYGLKDFSICKYEVTQDIYEKIMGENPSYHKGERHPVECVSWFDAIYFCNKLSVNSRLKPVYSVLGTTDVEKWNYVPHNGSCIDVEVVKDPSADGFRLPTKSEWEFAAKGGEDYFKYSGSDKLEVVGWYIGNSKSETHPVAEKKSNGYGIFDMNGNVCEWMWDEFRGNGKISRYVCGGSYTDDEYRCINDDFCYPEGSYRNRGFRLVRSV